VDINTFQASSNQRISSKGSPQRSIYILEGLSSELTRTLSDHLQLHTVIFANHERLSPLADRPTGERGGLPFLPSAVHGRDHVSLKYHEPMVFSTRPTTFRNICEASGRHIATTRLMGRFSEVGTARRKCTFWSRKTESGGWDCMSNQPERCVETSC